MNIVTQAVNIFAQALKFLDFWAGSYLLHYLSARLCWHIALEYGPDALIVPSLWGQDIIDAFFLEEKYPDFAAFMQRDIELNKFCEIHPVAERFNHKESNSLSTAGFPNVITTLVPGLGQAKQLGNDLAKKLRNEWIEIGEKVRDHIRATVGREITQSASNWNSLGQEVISSLALARPQRETLVQYWTKFGEKVRAEIRKLKENKASNSDPKERVVTNQERHDIFRRILDEDFKDRMSSQPSLSLLSPYLHDLRKWLLEANWEWNEIWSQQLTNSWEPYWSAVPLGTPNHCLTISQTDDKFVDWKNAQQKLSQAWLGIPSKAEEASFNTFNVGTWWGSFQQRLRIAIQAVKNTRTWNIPVAPGERSTISGQYSAVHPNLNYRVVNRRGEDQDFREGGGLPEGSMRLFWLLMSKAYPGLFSGSERLNALELTKRMAWQFGGVAKKLGVETTVPSQKLDDEDIRALNLEDNAQSEPVDYERLIRFPNLSSIAAARFVHDAIAQENLDPQKPRNSPPRRYWKALADAVRVELGDENKQEMRRRLASRTRCRAFQVAKTDQVINREQFPGRNFNGVMFSGKWLADDMGLEERQDIDRIRRAVQAAHQKAGFSDGSPSDWWVVVLADGDGMGQYISGSKLENYEKYLVDVDTAHFSNEITEDYRKLREETKKRMGPATHIGLNRALLDFSNRLVPYLTEKRFCGKVIYSGGDDVMAVLPLEDLPEYLRSLRAAWSGDKDPYAKQDSICEFNVSNGQSAGVTTRTGYWYPSFKGDTEADKRESHKQSGLPYRPLFTMGKTATMSMGVVIAHKTVPLPTVLENLWVAEGDRAKKMYGKDGICFRVIYSGGNTLEALMKGHLLDGWWYIAQQYQGEQDSYQDKLSPMLYRLAEELPKRVDVSQPELFALAAQVIMNRRDEDRKIAKIEPHIKEWLDNWAQWAQTAAQSAPDKLGATSDDLGYLLRFTAFWVDKMVQRQKWKQASSAAPNGSPELTTAGR